MAQPAAAETPHHRPQHPSQLSPARQAMLLLPLAPLSGSGHKKPSHASWGHSKRLQCCWGCRKPAVISPHPAQAPGDGAAQGKSLFFNRRRFARALGAQPRCMARDCPPASPSGQQRQTHTQVRIYFQIPHLYHSHMKYFFRNIAYT